jgi:hypothetical protein
VSEFYDEFLEAKPEFIEYFGHELKIDDIQYNCLATELKESHELKIGGFNEELVIVFTLWEDDFFNLEQPINEKNGKIVIFKDRKYRIERVESSVDHPMFQLFCSSIHK